MGGRGRHLCVMVKDLLSMLATNSTELVPAKRHSSVKLVPCVHPHSARLQSSAHTHAQLRTKTAGAIGMHSDRQHSMLPLMQYMPKC